MIPKIENSYKIVNNYLELIDIKSIFLDYYTKWSRYENVGNAIVNGLKTIDNLWERQGYEGFPFEQVDTIGYLVNEYFHNECN